MRAPREGRRGHKRLKGPTEGSEGLVKRLLALTDSPQLRLTVETDPAFTAELESIVDGLERKLTHEPPSPLVKGELDDEAVCDSSAENLAAHGSGESEIINRFPRARQRIMTVVPAAGRASVALPRRKAFPKVQPVSAAEQEERSRRTKEANERRAFRRSADRAIASGCRTWVTLTLRDEHASLDLTKARQEFIKSVRKLHRQETALRLDYVGAQVTEDGRPHVHVLLSTNLSKNAIRSAWPYGHTRVNRLSDSQIEQKVAYMIENQREGRSTYGRLFSSRGVTLEREEIPVTDTEDAREKLRDRITPQEPRLINARIFGGNPRDTFRFDPIRPGEGDRGVADLEHPEVCDHDVDH